MSTVAPIDVEQVASDYDRAWNAKDVEAIVAKHAEDGTYRLHVAGIPTLSGRDALRTAFTASLENWREVSFELDRILSGGGFYVWQSTVRGVLARPLELGAITVDANGARLELTGIDVITLDDQGLIATKETYFDIAAMANQAAQGLAIRA
jgi:steroid delta-isomerase-like uncharacterized protein